MPSNHEFFVGCIYEDCSFHPVLCTRIDDERGGDTELSGISLIDGSAPRSCSILHCGPELLTLEQATAIHGDFPGYQRRRIAEIDSESRGGGARASAGSSQDPFRARARTLAEVIFGGLDSGFVREQVWSKTRALYHSDTPTGDESERLAD